MNFVAIVPTKHLCRMVQCFWWMELDCENEQNDFWERVLPDGSSEIIFHLGENINRINSDGNFLAEPDAVFIGQNTHSYQITACGRVRMFGIKFFPHTFSFLRRERASHFTDRILELEDIFGGSIKPLLEKLRGAENPWAMAGFAEKFLTDSSRFRPSSRVAYLEFSVDRITRDSGQTNLGDLIYKLGISRRYFEKLFHEHVGLSPKTFTRIIQLQTFAGLLASSSERATSLTDLTQICGYYDQSHLIRSVKQLTGLTPSQLRDEKMPMQLPFLNSSLV